MLEISVLILLAKYVYKTAEVKGYPGALFAVVAVVSWFGCGITGAVIGYLTDPMYYDVFSFGALIGYVVGVGVAAAVNYLVVDGLHDKRGSDREPEPELAAAFADRDEDERRRRRPMTRREDGDDEPIVLTPAGGPAGLPRARRAWRKKWD